MPGYSKPVHARFAGVLTALCVLCGVAFPAWAQSVTSINAVGYINLTLPPGDSLVTFQLFNSTTLATAIQSPPEGTMIHKPGADGGLETSIFFLGSWSRPDLTLRPGEGFIFHNPTTSNYALTTVGEVPAGQLLNRLPAGCSLCASIVPHGGPLSSALQFIPPSGTKVWLLANGGTAYSGYTYANGQWSPSEPVIAVGQSFWVVTPQSYDWVRSFSIARMAGDFNLWDTGSPEVEAGYGFELGVAGRVAAAVPGYHYSVVQPEVKAGYFTYFAPQNANPANGWLHLGFTFQENPPADPANGTLRGQLYAGTSSQEGSLVPVGSPSNITVTTRAITMSTLVVPQIYELRGNYAGAGGIVSGASAGQEVFVQLRVWYSNWGASYEAAVGSGSPYARSAVISAGTGLTPGAGGLVLPASVADGLPVFSLKPPVIPVPVITRTGVTGNNVTVEFVSRPGVRYFLQRSTGVGSSAVWADIPGAEVTAGSGDKAELVHANGGAQPAQFYRVRKAN